jgi:hypothetical protein
VGSKKVAGVLRRRPPGALAPHALHFEYLGFSFQDLMGLTMNSKQLAATKLTSDTVGEFLDLGAERVRQLVKEGWISKDKAGGIRLGDAVRGYVKFLRSRATRSASDTRIRDARAREIELRTAQRAHELCETQEALDCVDEIIGMLKSDLMSLPARVTRDLAIRRDIERALTDDLNGASARLEARARVLQPDGETAARASA